MERLKAELVAARASADQSSAEVAQLREQVVALTAEVEQERRLRVLHEGEAWQLRARLAAARGRPAPGADLWR